MYIMAIVVYKDEYIKSTVMLVGAYIQRHVKIEDAYMDGWMDGWVGAWVER